MSLPFFIHDRAAGGSLSAGGSLDAVHTGAYPWLPFRMRR